MSTTKLVICTVVGTIYLFGIEYVWYALLGNGGEESDVMPAMQWLIVGYVLLALAFCLIYAKGVEPGPATQQGLKFGLMAGVFVYVATNFMWLAMADMLPCLGVTLMGTIKNSVFALVEMGLLGIIVANLSGLSNNSGGDRGETGGSDERTDPKPPPPKTVGG